MTITLDSTRDSFDKWRADRINSRDAIPQNLWDMVNELLKIHDPSTLRKTLRISWQQMRRSCSNFTVANLPEDDLLTHSFVTAIQPNKTCAGKSIKLTLSTDSRTLALSVDMMDLGNVLTHLGALL